MPLTRRRKSAKHSLYINGERGTGKTLVAKKCLTEDSVFKPVCYVPCTRFDTQYHVLREIHNAVASEEIGDGHHTAYVQRNVEDALEDQHLFVVLDDIDFLLENDGNDLLYYLTRMRNAVNLSIVAISANHPHPAAIIEDWTFSTLQPSNIQFYPYSEEEAVDILEHRVRTAGLLDMVDDTALTHIAKTTTNIKLGLSWLADAAAIEEDCITVDLLHTVLHQAE